MDLAVVIPAYDEEARLGASLRTILDYLERRGGSHGVLVVDDGSHDATSDVARGFAARGVTTLRLPENRGKGAAVRAGLAAQDAGRVLISDADLSTPIGQLEVLEPRAREAEIVLGSRALADSRITVHQPARRELAGKVFNLLVRAVGVRGIRDTQCGFKLLEGDAARRLAAEMTLDGFAWDVEMVWLARRLGYRVVEVGVEWRDDPASRVHLIRDSARMALDLFRFRRRHRRRARGGGG
jgi:dolichyl-phosphate beta-glucosyltransferase